MNPLAEPLPGGSVARRRALLAGTGLALSGVLSTRNWSAPYMVSDQKARAGGVCPGPKCST